MSEFRISNWFKDIDPSKISQLQHFNELLIKFNKTVNLVSPKTIPYSDVIHFSDSILASRFIVPHITTKKEIYDIGSGNGFPGIVLAILYPDISVILLDSDQRKCEFLKHSISELSLNNVSVKNAQVESLPNDTITYAVSRGFAGITKSLMSTRKSVVKGGAYFHMKSSEWSKEVAEMPTQLCSIWSPEFIGEYSLPLGEFKFAVVKTTKIS